MSYTCLIFVSVDKQEVTECGGRSHVTSQTNAALSCLRPFLFQVETGVAKMNTVTVASAVTMVTNNTRASDTAGGGGNVGVPTLVTNSLMGGGRTNPAGPQLEEEEQLQVEVMGGGDMNLLNFSPDEHQPLLRREQPPAESEPRPPPHQGRGSNSNNNNNRVASGSEVSDLSPTAQDTGPCLQKAPDAEHPGPDPQTTTVPESSSPEPATLRVSALDHVGQTQASRPARPSSLDLSSSCMSSGESDHGP